MHVNFDTDRMVLSCYLIKLLNLIQYLSDDGLNESISAQKCETLYFFYNLNFILIFSEKLIKTKLIYINPSRKEQVQIIFQKFNSSHAAKEIHQ